LPHVEGQIAAIALISAGVGRFDGASPSRGSADTDAAWMVARAAEGRGTRRADPAIAAVVALVLLAQPLFEQALDFVEVERFEKRAFLVGELFSHHRIAQPIQKLGVDLLGAFGDATKMRRECDVERIEVALSVDEDGARYEVKPLERAVVQPESQRACERHRFLHADRHLVAPQLVDEVDEHLLRCSVFYLSAPRAIAR
jgi:hypothetical protein